jgi:endonuclease YncB( thermonuclease family)
MKLFLLSLTLSLLPFVTNESTLPLLQENAAKASQIETHYDREEDKTTMRAAPVQISGEKAQYHSVHIAPAFSYSGQMFRKPDIVDFEVQTVVKTKLKIDLYVVFIVDGETIFLSSNRSAIKRPVAGKRWVGERMIFRMPYDTFLKITKAKTVEIKMDGVKIPLPEPALEYLRLFSQHLKAS